MGSWRAILMGVIGAILAAWLGYRWARWIPAGVNGKSRQKLQKEHGWKVRKANWLSFAGMVSAVPFYYLGVFGRSDWRGLGLSIGLMALLPACLLLLSSWRQGRQCIWEAFVCYAISQKTPPVVLAIIFAFAMAIGAAALVALAQRF